MKISVKLLLTIVSLIFLSGCDGDTTENKKADTEPTKEESESVYPPDYDENESPVSPDYEEPDDLNDISWEAEQYSGTNELSLSKAEQEESEEKALDAAACYQQMYRSSEKSDDLNETIRDMDITNMVSALSEAGYCAVGTSCNMAHSESVTDFCEKADRQEAASFDIYQVNASGGLLSFFFNCTGKDITVITASVSWNQQAEPVLTDMHKYSVEDYTLTENGYFVYSLSISDTMAIGESNAFRVVPIDEECQRLNEAYIKPIGYQGNNLFLTDWNEQNMESISLNDLYEYLYPLSVGSSDYEMPEDMYVDSDLFEQTMLTHLPLTRKQVQEMGVHADGKGYTWERFYTPQSVPVPEVRSYEKNEDGSITLLVYAVWLDYGTNLAFAHKVTLMEEPAGVRFLSNEIISSESNIMPEYTPRVIKN